MKIAILEKYLNKEKIIQDTIEKKRKMIHKVNKFFIAALGISMSLFIFFLFFGTEFWASFFSLACIAIPFLAAIKEAMALREVNEFHEIIQTKTNQEFFEELKAGRISEMTPLITDSTSQALFMQLVGNLAKDSDIHSTLELAKRLLKYYEDKMIAQSDAGIAQKFLKNNGIHLHDNTSYML